MKKKSIPIQDNPETIKAYQIFLIEERLYNMKRRKWALIFLAITVGLAITAAFINLFFGPVWFLVVGGFISLMHWRPLNRVRFMSKDYYYSLPGSVNHRNQHVCIYCGQWGIYRHKEYKSNTTYADCSKCSSNLWIE